MRYGSHELRVSDLGINAMRRLMWGFTEKFREADITRTAFDRANEAAWEAFKRAV